MTLATRSGKTEQALHLIDRKLGAHKGAGRVWLEGRRLTDAGFRAGVRYQLGTLDGALELRLSRAGDHVVSHKQGRPVVDLLTQALGPVERVQVRFERGAIRVQLHPLDQATRDRLSRLNGRIAAGQPLRLGSLCHGGGVASDALLRGMRAELAFAVEADGRYVDQSLDHGPASRGGMTVEGDLGDLDASVLPQVDVLEAGLPCISASRAGRSKKHLAQAEDDDATADLVVAFCAVVRATQPAVVVLENVPEYAATASAAIIRRHLSRLGYELHEQIIDGAAWSLEARQRWILTATTRGLSLDLGLVPTERPATLGEVLDSRTPASAWHTFSHLTRKEARDAAKGSKFQQRVLTPAATSVPTLRRGYQKGGSTDPRLAHPSRPGLSRLLSPSEHARIKGIPAALVQGLSATVAHEVLGQSVIAPSFVALGAAIAAPVR